MSNDDILSTLTKLLSASKAQTKSWLSRKLLVGAMVLAGFFALALTGRISELGVITWPAALVVSVYLICQAWEDVTAAKCKSKD